MKRVPNLMAASLCVVAGLMVLLVFASHWPFTPRVKLTFNGRFKGGELSFYPKFEDGSLASSFTLSNRISQRLYSSNARAQIQVKTLAGWTNVPNAPDSEPEPDDRIDKPNDRIPIMPQEGWRIIRHVPQKKLPWRLHVTYTVPAPAWSRVIVLDRIASSLSVRDKEYEIFSEEFPPEPAP